MKNIVHWITEQVAIYKELGWSRQWELYDFLDWYDREDHDHFNPTEMSQVVSIFLEKSRRLHRSYRILFVDIVHASNNFGQLEKEDAKISSEEFRLRAAKSISDLSNLWIEWLPYLNERAEHRLSELVDIASKAETTQIFDTICQKFVPILGYETASALMLVSKDFQEFENYYERVNTQVKFWRPDYAGLFRQPSETIQNLVFLETLIKAPRMQRCIQYNESRNTQYAIVSLKPLDEVRLACSTHERTQGGSINQIIDNLIDLYVQNIVRMSLNDVWGSISPYKIKWAYDKFTEYIPYESRTLDWTADNEVTRRYWNWQVASNAEHQRLVTELSIPLCPLFNELNNTDYDLLIQLLPTHIRIEEFTTAVNIPVDWDKDYEYEEGYKKWVGFYDIKVEVARPTAFVNHAFTFERLFLQDAINLLNNRGKIYELIRSHKKSP